MSGSPTTGDSGHDRETLLRRRRQELVTKTPVKIVIVVVALATLGFLFMRSVRVSRSAPYSVEPEELRNWTLALEPESGPNAPILVLRPPPDLVLGLFRQVFGRAGETLARPQTPGIPILLHDEFNSLLAGRVTPNALIGAARSSGIESSPPQPLCMGYRRVSEPGGTRQLYFVMFDAQAFRQVREQLGVDPTALSPVLFVAAAESDFNRWLPLRADPQVDCVAPISSS